MELVRLSLSSIISVCGKDKLITSVFLVIYTHSLIG